MKVPKAWIDVPIMDGQPVPHKFKRIDRLICCDCGLVHLMKITKANGGINLRLWRDNAETRKERRKLRAKHGIR